MKWSIAALFTTLCCCAFGARVCHQRNRILFRGKTFLDRNSSALCRINEVCGRFVIEGVSTRSPLINLTKDISKCVPRNFCDDVTTACAAAVRFSLPPVVVMSCDVTCCDADMCDSSSNGSDLPLHFVPEGRSSEVLARSMLPKQPTILHCRREAEVTIKGQSSRKLPRRQPCFLGVCAIFTFDGTSGGEHASGYSNICVRESLCNEQACFRIPDGKDILIERCRVMCCRTDYCNTGTLELPPPKGRLHCYDILHARNESGILVDKEEEMKCPEKDMKCVRVTATAMDKSFSKTITITSAGCVPKSRCKFVHCDFLLDAIKQIGALTSCNVECCDGEYCNDVSLSPDTERPGFVRRCYNILSTKSGGTTLLDRKSLAQCGQFDQCFRIDATATLGSSGGEVTIGYGGCIYRDFCKSLNCSLLQGTMPSAVSWKDCRAWCCDGELCNEKKFQMVQRMLLTDIKLLTCHDILTFRGVDKRAIKTCDDPDQRCMRLDGETRFPGQSLSKVTFAGCVPRTVCVDLDCKKRLPKNPALSWSCGAFCCGEDRCNGVPAYTSPTGRSMDSLPPLAGRAAINLATSAESPIQCYDVQEVRANGNLLLEPRREVKRCEAGSKCFKIEATADAVTATYGSCTPKEDCDDLTCKIPTKSGMELAVDDCQVFCCDSDFCNG